VVGGSIVNRDGYVHEWRVSGDKVCRKFIEAGPGCLVLDVEYDQKYVRTEPGPYLSGLVSPVFALAEEEERTHRTEYQAWARFAIPVEMGRGYFVTATFTGDVFLPRIVVMDVNGNKIGEIQPARSQQEVSGCLAGASPPKAASRSSSHACL
jgi:hypothetical protein